MLDPLTHLEMYQAGEALVALSKHAADGPTPSYSLTGRLYVSESGWALLSVPNALVRGIFDAMQEPGIQLPTNDKGVFNAHISVMTKDELDLVGGPKAISERGHSFSYQLGQIKAVTPKSWDGVSKVWFVEVQSPELKALRKSYGLSALPNGDHEFHITSAVRKTGVLGKNELSKAAGDLYAPTDTKKKKKRSPFGLVTGAAGLGALGLGGAYALASDNQLSNIDKGLAAHHSPLGPDDTRMTRYGDVMSHGAAATPFGMSVGDYITALRAHPRLLQSLGQDPSHAVKGYGAQQESRAHYEEFAKGPIPAYWHQLRANGDKDKGGNPRSINALPPSHDGPAVRYLTGSTANQPVYREVIQPKFDAYFRQWLKDNQPAEGKPGHPGAAGASWLDPYMVDQRDPGSLSHDTQMEILRGFNKSLDPELRAEKMRIENAMGEEFLTDQQNNYAKIMQGGRNVRNTLKDVGVTAAGAAGGGALGYYLHKLLADKKDNGEDDDSSWGRWASTAGGAGLGGIAAYLGGSESGRRLAADYFKSFNKASAELSELAEIKLLSDKKNYKAKVHKIKALMAKNPEEWSVSNDAGHYSVKHNSGYRYHVPISKFANLIKESLSNFDDRTITGRGASGSPKKAPPRKANGNVEQFLTGFDVKKVLI